MPVAGSWTYFSAIHTSPHLTSTHLTPYNVNNKIFTFTIGALYCGQCSEQKLMSLMSYELFSLFGICLDR
jgi:hypothetical protein